MIKIDTDKSNLDINIDIHKLLLDEIGAYVYVKDKNKKYIYVNKVTQKLFNKELESILGSYDSDYFSLTELSEITKNDNIVIEQGKTVTGEEFNTIKETGELRIYRSVKQPIYNKKQEIIGLFGVSTDITDIYNLKEELKRQASTDSLTGLYNRRSFLEISSRAFSESVRHETPMSLIMMDIDFFKKINDSFGHPAGDAVISFIGNHTSNIIRKEDIFARIGGEEFAILLPNTNIRAAHILAEKIRSTLAEQSISGKWIGEICPKLSLGVTSRHKEDQKFDDIYIRSDDALYTAKDQGRNRVSIT